MTRSDVISEALLWIGTPYQHQAHLRGIGCDCGGLIGGVASALGLCPDDWWETEFAPYSGYARQAQGRSLLDVLDKFMLPIAVADAVNGDVIAMRFRRDAQHVGFLVPHGSGQALLHALGSSVVRHLIDKRWRSRFVQAYALPGVD